MELPAENKRYTFADVLTWDESERIEIINGEAFMMAPPSRVHQEISVAIAAQLYNYLEGKRCKVYPAPFGVRLFEQDGARPDLIIEILSPSTQRHDRLVKLGLYQRAGVREYWTVNPEDKTVQVMLRDDYGVLQLHEVYGRDGVAKVNVLNGCFIELVRVFPE